MPRTPRPRIENTLLAAVPARARRSLLARCERVELTAGEVLCQPGTPMRHVYFPLKSFVAMVAPMADGEIQVGMVGSEGMIGVSLVLGERISSLRGLVQGDGSAWKLAEGPFRQVVDRSPALRQTLNRYLCVLIGELAQNTGCARFHLVEARLARWLLMARDRAHGNSFFITHAFLADMLGVRRVGVTNAASALQARRLIHYSRGNVTILNGRALEAVACDCYRSGKLMYDAALGRGARST